MSATLKSFRTFRDQDSLDYFAELLRAAEIPFLVQDHSPSFDPSFAYNKFDKAYSVEIEVQYFKEVYALEEQAVSAAIQNAPADYYLFSYNVTELQEIIAARDQWNAYDYFLAKKILQKKGLFLDEVTLSSQQEQRISKLKQVSDIKKGWLLLLYGIAFFGGIFAILLGYYIKTAKITLPNGETISRFTKKDVLHGKFIFFVGIFFLIFWLAQGYYFSSFLHFQY